MANIFNVSVDTLISSENIVIEYVPKQERRKLSKRSIISISLLSAGIVWFIATIAFVILVIFACISLSRVSKVLKETNESVKVLSADVDSLSKETEKLLGNTNSLLEDLNKKSVELDPAVKAVADVGQSVSNVNEAVNNFVERHEERQSKFSGFTKFATQAVAMNAWRKIRQHRQAKKQRRWINNE